MSVLPAATIWRDKEVDGVYSSDDHDPSKPEIRAWGAWVESALSTGTLNAPWEATAAALGAKLAYDDGDPGFVYEGADFGTYRKSGASGVGSWVKILDTIPGYQVVKATNASAGTANAIVATSAPPVSYSDGMQIIGVNITETNTSATVTVNFNGLGDLTIKTASDNNPAVGGLVAPVRIWGQVDGSGTVFRMMSDQASAAIQAGAEAALAEIRDLYLGSHASDALATAAAGGAPAEGALYVHIGTQKMRVFLSGNWAALTDSNNWAVEYFDGDGTTNPITLAGDPGSANNVFITIKDGLSLQPVKEFTLGGAGNNELSNDEAWPVGVENIEVRYATSIGVGTPADGSVTEVKLGSNAVTRVKIADDAVGADEIDDEVINADHIDTAAVAAILAKLGITAGIAFAANKNGTNQTGIVSATWTKLTFTNEEWDVGGYYDAANSRFTPPAGKYELTPLAYLSAGAVDTAEVGIAIYKNGTIHRSFFSIANTTGSQAVTFNAAVTANGTDYFEAFFYAGGAGNKTVSGTISLTSFHGKAI